MCDDDNATRKKSDECEMKTEPSDHQQQQVRPKRTFTLTRNPLTRMSKRKPPQQQQQHPPSESEPTAESKTIEDVGAENKKIYRRSSFRKILNKIAAHIGGVNPVAAVVGDGDDSRVPPVGFQTWGPDDTPGVTGLRNHGNTCFINAVLQCISHTDVLAEYFVLDRYKIDLSRRNKLNSKKHGTKGEVTEQLAVLLKALWACQYCPDFSITFKQVVERYGAQYKGTQQHDALEFLIWLLDKVHEDLNMAPKKKYKSIKTLGRSDEVIAAETLENYRRRDNSFIHAVFQAQYRSSLSCPRCLTQSNTFDPFQCISVQLPQLHRHSVYVTVLYTSQQPRSVKIGLSLASGANVSELRDLLESDTSISRCDMLLTEINEAGFVRTFADLQAVSSISEMDSMYCIEMPQLKDTDEESQSAYVLLCWINVVANSSSDGGCTTFSRFGSPYTMQINRETSFVDLQKLMLKEMAPILHDDVLTALQPTEVFRIRVPDPACSPSEPPCYLEPQLEHPLFMEAIDQALALCSEDSGPPHVKLVLEWTPQSKSAIIADDVEDVEEHSSVKQLKAQALQGGAPLTLEECLKHYTKAETLDDAWRCPQCQQYQPVIKTLDMWSLPDILVVHFKRFRQQTLRGRNSTKLVTMVDFPVYAFDMTPHLANKHSSSSTVNSNLLEHQQQNQNPVNWSPWKRQHRKQSCANDNTYDLYAVCYHHGTDLETGHYTAACKNPYDSNWYLYDDAKVTNLTLQQQQQQGDAADISAELVNNSAYILFYQKRSAVNGHSSGSSNSSSAASTSSVHSNDHWVSRMPRFIPPKNLRDKRKISTNTPVIGEQQPPPPASQLPPPAAAPTITKTATIEIQDEDPVTLRNSQNAVYNSCTSIRKSDVAPPAVITADEDKKPQTVYTTSIHITPSPNSKAEVVSVAEVKSPVFSINRWNVFNKDLNAKYIEDTVRKTKSLYADTETANAPTTCLVTEGKAGRLSWMSPQPVRKMHESQVSV